MGTRPVGAPPPWIVAATLVGGALVCAGTILPWMSFFAGLQPLSGLVGLYGRILFVSGALAVGAGAAMRRQRMPQTRWLPPAIGVLGILQVLFVVWLLRGLQTTIRGLGMHAMLLARPGPGLFVTLAGALLVASTVRGRWPSGGRP